MCLFRGEAGWKSRAKNHGGGAGVGKKDEKLLAPVGRSKLQRPGFSKEKEWWRDVGATARGGKGKPTSSDENARTGNMQHGRAG